MKLEFFAGISSLQDLKKAYRKLVLVHHPDVGGDERIMKRLNNEYEKVIDLIRKDQANPDSKKAFYDIPREFFAIVEALLKLRNIDVEICGSWIWITGNTKEHAQYLKSHGCKFAPKKSAWYWYCGEYRKKSRRTLPLDEIRERYGSDKIIINGNPQMSFV